MWRASDAAEVGLYIFSFWHSNIQERMNGMNKLKLCKRRLNKMTAITGLREDLWSSGVKTPFKPGSKSSLFSASTDRFQYGQTQLMEEYWKAQAAWETPSPAVVTKWELHPPQPQKKEVSSYCMRKMQWALSWLCWTSIAFGTHRQGQLIPKGDRVCVSVQRGFSGEITLDLH